MEHNFKSILSGGGFYVALSLCLLLVGVGGYFLLLEREDPQEEPGSVTQTVSPTPEITQQEEPEEVQEVSEPVVIEEPQPVMPTVEVDDTPVVAQAPRTLVTPLEGDVVATFSMDQLMYNETLGDWRTHDGVDISANPGTTVLAASAGTVLSVEDDPLMGVTVTLRHDDGYVTTYANLQENPTVEVGDSVSAGQIVGAVGTTAIAESSRSPHLHFSVTKDGQPVDPEEYLNS